MLWTCLSCITVWTALLKGRTSVWLNVKNCDESGIHPTCKLIRYLVIVSWVLVEETGPLKSETKDFHGIADIMNLMFIWESLTPRTHGYDPDVGQGYTCSGYTCTEFVLELKNLGHSKLNLYMGFASKLAQFLSRKEILSLTPRLPIIQMCLKRRIGTNTVNTFVDTTCRNVR